MDLRGYLADLVASGQIDAIAENTVAQFGTRNREYVGATLLPERNVNKNVYRETNIRYRTVIANAGTRYSPSQKKAGGELAGSMLVELSHSDIAREFTGEDYDALVDYLNQDATMDAAAAIIGWTDAALNQALVEHNERMRWQAIVNGSVPLIGDNGYRETVVYPNPAGHRVAAAGAWNSNAYDPFTDILAMVSLLRSKGYELTRIITSTRVVSTLLANQNVARRAGRLTIVGANEYFWQVRREDLDNLFDQEGLPPIETYDQRYFTQTGSQRFMPEDSMTFFAGTGRDVEVENTMDPDDIRFVPDTVGYTAVGRAVGQQGPGRVIRLEAFDNKPPRIEGEAWQTSLPVLADPEAFATITGITMT